MRQINDEGLEDIKRWEGKYLTAYHGAADRPGLLTIGYGHTDAAGPPHVMPGMTISEEQANQILRSDLSKCEAAVERDVKVPLNDNQFAALVSFVFNVGEGNFEASSLLRKLNTGDYNCVPNELMKWTKANGKYVQGLANRRAVEAGRWAKGAPVASQYVEPDLKTDSILSKPEVLSSAASGAAAVATPLASGSIVLQVALAVIIVVAAGIAAYYIIRRINEHKM